MNTEKNTNNESPFADSPLDDLLKDWHGQNAQAAQDSRESLASKLTAECAKNAPTASIGVSHDEKDALVSDPTPRRVPRRRWVLPLAAMLALVGAVAVWFGPMPLADSSANKQGDLAILDLNERAVGTPIIVRPEEESRDAGSISAAIPAHVLNASYTPIAGRLDAHTDAGESLGACPLEHTDVDVDIAGRFARVSLTQRYYNTFTEKIEAVYTFPMSQDAAVDSMRITVGDRAIEAEIQERDRARQIYEAARARGNTAALLEQERPNIFTQSVANIEPGEQVSVHISYIELVSESDGIRSFDFPMVVAPRYIPGGTPPRNGMDSPPVVDSGEAFADRTEQVPDAERITPMPTHPDTRAGHDISINVAINTGGPALLGIDSGSHKINITNDAHGFDEPRLHAELSLASFTEIPNKDFVLTWRQESGFIEPAVFTHSGDLGSFATIVLEPPARVDDTIAVPKELVFVLDTSGSMNGQPIEKAKQVIDESLQALRPQDTFNVITFAGSTRLLWDDPQPGTPENIQAAREFIASMRGAGGTEMMHAINKALMQDDAPFQKAMSPEELAQLPADGRRVIVRVPFGAPQEIDAISGHVSLHLLNNRSIETSRWIWLDNTSIHCPVGVPIFLTGRWTTEDARRILWIEAARYMEPARPLRIVAFLTDGHVGNDQAIIAAVQRNAASTRVFSFGVGSSPNRYLLDSMARASKGEVEYIGLDSDAGEKASRFAERISSPVLRDVTITLPRSFAGAQLSSPDLFDPPRLLSSGADGSRVYELPDLFDVKPITIHARLDRPAAGEVVFGGRSPLGEFSSSLPIVIDRRSTDPQLPSLWARAEVAHIMNHDLLAVQQGTFPAELRDRVVELGIEYSIMTRYTSFVAVDRARVTLRGEPKLVRVPVELPEGMNYWKIFSRLPSQTQVWLQPSFSQIATHTQPQPRNLNRTIVNGEDGGEQADTDDAAAGGIAARATTRTDKMGEPALMAVPMPSMRESHPITNFGRRARFVDADNKRAQLVIGDITLLGDVFDASAPGEGIAHTDGITTGEGSNLSDELYPSRKRVRLFITKVDLDLLIELSSAERDAPIIVSILMSDITEESLRALADTGATIEGTSTGASIVIASVMPGGFEALVNLETVLRIEPAAVKPAA